MWLNQLWFGKESSGQIFFFNVKINSKILTFLCSWRNPFTSKHLTFDLRFIHTFTLKFFHWRLDIIFSFQQDFHMIIVTNSGDTSSVSSQNSRQMKLIGSISRQIYNCPQTVG